MTPSRLLVLTAVLLGLAACAVEDAGQNPRVIRDIAYGDNPRQRLDVYLPRHASPRMPTVLFIHGGEWVSGTKAQYAYVGEALAERGYAAVLAEYRLYPEVRYPAFLQDVAAATAWTKGDMAKAVGIAPAPLYLAGHSAGAYNAVMLSLDPRWLAAHGLKPCEAVAATAGLDGPYDFISAMNDTMRGIFGQPTPQDTQPIAHANDNAPPMLLMNGLADKIVSPHQARELAAAIRAKGGIVEDRFDPRLSHMGMVEALAADQHGKSPVFAQFVAFLETHAEPRCR